MARKRVSQQEADAELVADKFMSLDLEVATRACAKICGRLLRKGVISADYWLVWQFYQSMSETEREKFDERRGIAVALIAESHDREGFAKGKKTGRATPRYAERDRRIVEMHDRQGKTFKSIAKALSKELDIDMDEEATRKAYARAKTRPTEADK
jgi:hypothetical protein